MTNATHGSPPPESKFRIDFIDPLFAVAIHIAFADGLMTEKWLEERRIPTQPDEIANVFLFAVGIATLVASWLGYHQSILQRPIVGNARFVWDVILLILYILLLLYFKSPIAVCVFMFSIFAVYVFWDYCKTVEDDLYKDYYYNRYSTKHPSFFTYLCRCAQVWFHRDSHNNLMGEAVTFGWSIYFGLLVPFALIPVPEGYINAKKLLAAATIFLGVRMYRYDKKHSGAWICSVIFKLVMAIMFIGLVGCYVVTAYCTSE